MFLYIKQQTIKVYIGGIEILAKYNIKRMGFKHAKLHRSNERFLTNIFDRKDEEFNNKIFVLHKRERIRIKDFQLHEYKDKETSL